MSMRTTPASQKIIRIGGASGFWGDSAVAAPQLVKLGNLDYIVFDYLAELTMSILAAARAKNPELGYATDFVTVTMKNILQDVVAQNIRVISNAGGVNPQACAKAIEAIAAELGLSVKIAVVLGDDVMPLLPALRENATAGDASSAPSTTTTQHITELQSGASLPAKVLTANAYLGALPVKAALDAGAQIVITGRCVDSAVTLGALMHEFGWADDANHIDYDRLAQASLAGHIIECGCQATGGLHTDWQDVPDWPNIGYPIIECHEDGHFIATKPPGTGGLVNPAIIAEQMLYEIGDPANYLLPDVVCDFTQVTLLQIAEHRVQVSGARGKAPSAFYKVCATYMDGFRCNAQLTIVGTDAAQKALRTGDAILTRTRSMFTALGLADYSRTAIEIIGDESCNFGPHAQTPHVREAILRVAVMHPQKAALELFAREIAPAGTSWSPGTTGSGSGRSSPSPCIKQFAFLLEKHRLTPSVQLGDTTRTVAIPHDTAANLGANPQLIPPGTAFPELHTETDADTQAVPLIQLAYARSGDKGNTSNIGIIARHPRFLPLLRTQLTPKRVAAYLAHLVRGTVTRYEVPGIHAFNFVCTEALDGGGMASLRNDPLGKGMGQILLTLPVRITPILLTEVTEISTTLLETPTTNRLSR